MHAPKLAAPTVGFNAFYESVFLAEHQHWLTITLHMLGTAAGLVWLFAMPLLGWPWLVLLFPVVHAVPGLIGHRLVERNQEVGDIRFTRKDYSPLWFILANHRLAWDLLMRKSIKPKR